VSKFGVSMTGVKKAKIKPLPKYLIYGCHSCDNLYIQCGYIS